MSSWPPVAFLHVSINLAASLSIMWTSFRVCKGTTLTTLRPPLSSGLLRRIYVFHYYHLIHVLTFTYFLLRPSPTFGDVAVHIPFLIPSFHIVPFPFSMIPHPSETCPTVS